VVMAGNIIYSSTDRAAALAVRAEYSPGYFGPNYRLGIFQVKEDPEDEEPSSASMRSVEFRDGSHWTDRYYEYGPFESYDEMRLRSHP
jgi:hypothetical protein